MLGEWPQTEIVFDFWGINLTNDLPWPVPLLPSILRNKYSRRQSLPPLARIGHLWLLDNAFSLSCPLAARIFLLGRVTTVLKVPVHRQPESCERLRLIHRISTWSTPRSFRQKAVVACKTHFLWVSCFLLIPSLLPFPGWGPIPRNWIRGIEKENFLKYTLVRELSLGEWSCPLPWQD